MLIFQKEGKEKEILSIAGNDLNIPEKIWINKDMNYENGINLYYCKKKTKKIAEFLKESLYWENIVLRCFTYFPHEKYDLIIEIGNFEDENECLEKVIKIAKSLRKTYMILEKGYYLPLDIFSSFTYNN